MKIWEVELKERKTPCRTHEMAPILERIQVSAKDCNEAGNKALRLTHYQALVTKIELIAETLE